MPSPVGHSLIGLTFGAAWFVRPAARGDTLRAALWRSRGPLAWAVVAANGPDADYLPGLLMGSLNAVHRWYSHTLGWSLLSAVAIWLILRQRPLTDGPDGAAPRRAGWAALLALTVIALSHLAADWLTEDLSPPYGLMAFWPFTDRFFIAPRVIFPHLQKECFGQFCCWHNVWALAVEVAWCLPLLLAVLFYKRTRIRHADPAKAGG